MLASLTGVIFLWKGVGKFIEKNLSVLVSFSAGVFLVVVFLLGQETLHMTHTFDEAWPWILVGVVFITLVFRLLPSFHHHHDAVCTDHNHSSLDVRRIMLSDAIHNIGDGVLIAAAFSLSIPFGIATALGVLVHEAIQEVSEFFVLRQAGFSTKRALLINFAVSSTILVGALGGYFLLDTITTLQVPILGIATGSFLVVVLHDLIPESIRNSHIKKNYFVYIFWFMIGIGVMFTASRLLGHSHDIHLGHEGDIHEDEHGEEVYVDEYHEDEHYFE
ncbi:MAG: ZIP family metal transporter [Candidatus Pacebacteria bacterium]|nr:ZIP family metal transporter [Candidatus Paceibacterota bacterium]